MQPIDLVLGIALLLTLGVVVTGGMHLALGAPYVPTPPHIVQAMLHLVEWRGEETVYDLGAGDGRFLLAAKERYPGIRAIGCEAVPTVWALARVRMLLQGSDIRMRLCRMQRMDVRDADVVFLYLFPGLMQELEAKFDRELRPGTIVIAHTFGFADRVPVRTVRVPRLGGEVDVFLYRWQPSVAAQV